MHRVAVVLCFAVGFVLLRQSERVVLGGTIHNDVLNLPMRLADHTIECGLQYVGSVVGHGDVGYACHC